MLLDRRSVKELVGSYLTERKPTARRLGFLAGWGALFSSVRLAVQAARRVDDLLFRDYRATTIRSPFFIFANPRSGTTLLQYLMSLDEERFTHYKFWQTILPTVSFYRFIEKVIETHDKYGRPLEPAMDKVGQFFFGGWEGIHTLGFSRPEEDECLFVFTGVAPGLVLLFPDITKVERIQHLDEQDAAFRSTLMSYYEDSLKRHVYATGGDRQFLNKNVFTITRVKALYDQFPDGRFIYIMRHPYDAIPSCINLFYVCWKAHSPDIAMDSPETRAIAQWSIDGYRKAYELRNELPKEQYLIVNYRDLITDPVECVQKIYVHFGLEVSDAFRARLASVDRNSGAEEFKASVKYTLADYGIEKEFVYEQLKDIFEAYGYDP